jgi:GT2 family glycosyltransferase
MSLTTSSHEDVSAVIVTYGDRSELCQQVLRGALACGVGRVIIVDNGSDERARDALAAVVDASGGAVELNSVGRNAGSAGGFGRGIQLALRRGECSHVWLLDDDTVPEATALDELLAWGARLGRSLPPDTALVSYRPARLVQRLLVRGVSAATVFPSPSAVMGFNVADIFQKVIHRLTVSRRQGHPVHDPIEIPYGPYGGLLIPRELVALVGYPNEQLFVYEDDTDYTWRLGAAASGLFLVPTSVLIDLEPSWPDRARGRSMFGRALTSESPGRVFYQVRNRVFFEVQHRVGSTWLHRTNRSLYLALMWVSAVRLRRTSRYRLIASAVRAGERAHLGVVSDLRM